MRIVGKEQRNKQLIDQMTEVWEGSVRATHLFLSDKEIAHIKQYVPQALRGVERLAVEENTAGQPVAFMGWEGRKLEMLFVAPEYRGRGLGKSLLMYAVNQYDVRELAVNEQNPRAKGFYEHLGFRVYKRTDKDEQGNPYPLLYMKRT